MNPRSYLLASAERQRDLLERTLAEIAETVELEQKRRADSGKPPLDDNDPEFRRALRAVASTKRQLDKVNQRIARLSAQHQDGEN